MAQLRREARQEARQEETPLPPPDEIIFLLATLLADDRLVLDSISRGNGLPEALKNLGAALDDAEREQDADAHTEKNKGKPDPQRRESRFERRLRLLLDAELTPDGAGELPFRLRQCVHLVLSLRDGKARIDWGQLLYDLWRWNWPNRPVRREWARAFYGDPRAFEKARQKAEDESEEDLVTDIEV